MRTLLASSLLATTSGCSSIVEGTSQEITLNTNPASAQCALYRQGTKIGEVQTTPGSMLVKKTSYDITVVCGKDGYQQATFFDRSGAAGATAGNILLGGGIGWAIDSASGADNKYDTPINLTMVPVQPGQATAPPPQAAAMSFPVTLPTPVHGWVGRRADGSDRDGDAGGNRG